MFFSQWIRTPKKAPVRSRGYRPSLISLEDRVLPSGFHFLPPPGPAASLMVEVPHSVTSGQSFYVEVEALDAANHLATGYTGTVTLSLGTADPGVVYNSTNPYTFKTSDYGMHFFQVTLAAAGPQTILASGTPPAGSTPITGSAAMTVLPAPTLASLLVVTPEQAAVGVPAHVTVEAIDGSGHLLRNYTGTVTLSTSDLAATGLPATYTFTAPNNGVHTFNVTFQTGVAAGTSTTVTANVGSITDTATLTVYPATTVTHFGFVTTGIFGASLGNPTPVTLVALNAANQPVTGYLGTVTFTSSDSAATISATKAGTYSSLGSFSYTFQATDNGAHKFYLKFGTVFTQTLTATDSANNISGTTQIWVSNFGLWFWWW